MRFSEQCKTLAATHDCFHSYILASDDIHLPQKLFFCYSEKTNIYFKLEKLM